MHDIEATHEIHDGSLEGHDGSEDSVQGMTDGHENEDRLWATGPSAGVVADPGDVLGIELGAPEPMEMQELGALFGLHPGTAEEQEAAYLAVAAPNLGHGEADDEPTVPQSLPPDQPEQTVATTERSDPDQSGDNRQPSPPLHRGPADQSAKLTPADQAALDTSMTSMEQMDHESNMAILNNLRV